MGLCNVLRGLLGLQQTLAVEREVAPKVYQYCINFLSSVNLFGKSDSLKSIPGLKARAVKLSKLGLGHDESFRAQK